MSEHVELPWQIDTATMPGVRICRTLVTDRRPDEDLKVPNVRICKTVDTDRLHGSAEMTTAKANMEPPHVSIVC